MIRLAMVRAALDKPDLLIERSEIDTVDERLASLLEAIEDERTPERLLRLAVELQDALTARRQLKARH
jgi:hypothetical protein